MIEPIRHKLTEAIEGQAASTDAPAGNHGPPEPQGHGSNPKEVAEQTRLEQESLPHGRPDREDYLTTIGRGQQTHG